MDIQKLIEQVLGGLKGDQSLLQSFQTNPVKVVEGLLNIDLPDEQLEAIVKAVQAKLKVDDLGGLLGKVGGLFGKK